MNLFATRVEVTVDGGMRNCNPGEGGWGGVFCVFDHDNMIISEKYFGFTFGDEIVTNNVCEFRAIAGALQILIEKYTGHQEYTIISDSKLAVNQINGTWEVNDSKLKAIRNVVWALEDGLKRENPSASLEYLHRKRAATTRAHDHVQLILNPEELL